MDEARERLPKQHHSNLILGDFLKSNEVENLEGRCRLIYWNDVFEHIAVDEIEDYLDRIYRMLAPGGELISITPNWHMRPSDVTADYKPPRTTAIGFHLKEYTLREISGLLKNAGFISKTTDRVKVLGRGELSASVTVKVNKFSQSAKAKIEAAGGTAIEL